MNFTSMPRRCISSATRSIERTTPLTCGCQASVTMRTERGRLMAPSTTAFRRELEDWSPRQAPQKGRAGLLRPFPRMRYASLALGELEAAAGFSTAVLLAFHHAAVAGKEAALLEHGAKLGLEVSQCLADAVADGAGLAGEAAAGDGRDHVVLVLAGRGDDRLLEDHLQHRTGEEDVELLAVYGDLAVPGLDPDARDGVLALAGRVGAAFLVQLLDVDGRLRGSGRHDGAEVFERGDSLGHYLALTFLGLKEATSTFCGC